jgi:hypothetical protein
VAGGVLEVCPFLFELYYWLVDGSLLLVFVVFIAFADRACIGIGDRGIPNGVTVDLVADCRAVV